MWSILLRHSPLLRVLLRRWGRPLVQQYGRLPWHRSHLAGAVTVLPWTLTYIRATIMPAGVGISPPIASRIKPSCTRRVRCAEGIVRVINPLATKHSDEYSATVKSDLLGILFMGSPVGRAGHNAGRTNRVQVRIAV